MANDIKMDKAKFSTPENTRAPTASVNSSTGLQSEVSSQLTVSPSLEHTSKNVPSERPGTCKTVSTAKKTIVATDTIPSEDDIKTNEDNGTEGLDSIMDELNSLGHMMPRYCVTTTKISSLGTFTVDMKSVLSEMEESGDGGDSNVDGELAESLDEAVQESRAEKRQYLDDNESVAFVD